MHRRPEVEHGRRMAKEGDPADRRTFVYPGGLHVVEAPASLVTIVGSCVAVCLRVPSGEVGGMVHFLMPFGPANPRTRMGYANHAVPALVEAVRALANDPQVEAKLAGGAQVQGAAPGQRRRMGTENIDAARRTLASLDVKIVSEAVGGCYGRRVLYDVGRGDMRVQELGSGDGD